MDAPTPNGPAVADVELRQVWPGYDPMKAAVVMSNALATAATELTRFELRVLLLAISAIHQDDTVLPLTAIDLQAYLDVYHPGTKRHTLTKELEGVLKRLVKRRVTLPGQPEQRVPWIDAASSCVIPAAASETGRATLLIRLHPSLTSELTQQRRQFARLPLAAFTQHESVYSMRLLLLLRARGAWKAIHTTLDVDDLRGRFGVEDAYEEWRDFRKRVLQVAVKELREHNQMDIQLRLITRLRRAYQVRFEVKLLAKPLPAGDAESLERWATDAASSLGFHGDLEYYADALGWPVVTACIQRAQAAIEADDRIDNPGGYLRTVLETELEARAEADSASEPASRKKGTDLNLWLESDRLLSRYHEERGEFLERVWEGLPENEREELEERIDEDISKRRGDAPYAPSATLRAVTRLRLLQQMESASFPPELVDLGLFVEKYQLLTNLEPDDQAKVIEHLKSSLVEAQVSQHTAQTSTGAA